MQRCSSKLDAWLMFIASDQPCDIREVIEAYPEFTNLYREVFEFRYHKKELISMYSDALKILDANTTQYMIEIQQEQIEKLREENHRQQEEILRLQKLLVRKDRK